MNKTELEKRIWTLARACPPSDHVPYAFEKRIMAALRAHAAPDPVSAWARLLWRSAAPCLALTLLLAVYALQLPENANPSAGNAARVDPAELNLEDALLAPIREEVSLARAW